MAVAFPLHYVFVGHFNASEKVWLHIALPDLWKGKKKKKDKEKKKERKKEKFLVNLQFLSRLFKKHCFFYT